MKSQTDAPAIRPDPFLWMPTWPRLKAPVLTAGTALFFASRDPEPQASAEVRQAEPAGRQHTRRDTAGR